MASVKSEARELDREEEEVVTPSDNNVSLQEFTTGASGYVEYTGVIKGESESNIMKRLKIFLKRQKKRCNSITAICGCISTETKNRRIQQRIVQYFLK